LSSRLRRPEQGDKTNVELRKGTLLTFGCSGEVAGWVERAGHEQRRDEVAQADGGGDATASAPPRPGGHAAAERQAPHHRAILQPAKTEAELRIRARVWPAPAGLRLQLCEPHRGDGTLVE
jgi:hypothetical protein